MDNSSQNFKNLRILQKLIMIKSIILNQIKTTIYSIILPATLHKMQKVKRFIYVYQRIMLLVNSFKLTPVITIKTYRRYIDLKPKSIAQPKEVTLITFTSTASARLATSSHQVGKTEVRFTKKIHRLTFQLLIRVGKTRLPST